MGRGNQGVPLMSLKASAWPLLLALGGLSGCASLNSLFTSPRQLGQQLIVDTSHDYLPGMEDALKAGADVNAVVTRTGRGALMLAASRGYPDAAQLLIAAHANVNQSDVFGRTALLDACDEGHADVAKILLAAGADFRAKSNIGETALDLAASTGSVPTIKMLLSAGADVNAPGPDGWRPLMYAVSHARTDAVKALVAAGADVEATTSDKDTTAMTIARRLGRRDIEAILQRAAAAKDRRLIDWVKIPGGTFLMGTNDPKPDFGDAKPVHRVTLAGFYMSRTLVTNRQYRACVNAGACSTAPNMKGFNGDDQPVVGVNWDQAEAFAAWAGGRLPSEAEWEYAARSGGKDWKYPWGDGDANCGDAVIAGCGWNATAPVCSKPAGNTAQGLCDMAGNAWEWLADWFHDSYKGAPLDGGAWIDPAGSARVFRGGSWNSGADAARAANRASFDPGYHANTLGFRVARP